MVLKILFEFESIDWGQLGHGDRGCKVVLPQKVVALSDTKVIFKVVSRYHLICTVTSSGLIMHKVLADMVDL